MSRVICSLLFALHSQHVFPHCAAAARGQVQCGWLLCGVQCTGGPVCCCASAASLTRHRWSKSSVSQSEAVRQYAVQELSSDAYLDGAFLIRDSTSRAGCFALSLKFHGDVTHFLIELNPNGSVQVMDATTSFPTIAALICHHCIEADGLALALA